MPTLSAGALARITQVSLHWFADPDPNSSNLTTDSLTFDVTRSEQHQADVEVTDHPVEQGANITDHARPKPEVVTFDAIISNTPLSRAQVERTVVTNGIRFQSTAPVNPTEVPGYAEAAYQKLKALRNGGVLVNITTGLRQYASMLVTSLSVPRDAQTGDALRFTIAFKQILLVTNQTSKVVIAAEPKAQPLASEGTKAAKTTTKDQPGYYDRSWGGQIYNVFKPGQVVGPGGT